MQSTYEDYLDLMDKSHDEKCEIPSMSYLSLSTMTIIAQLNGEIDITLLNRNFKSPMHPLCTIIPAKEHHEYELTARGKKKKSFYNQTTIRFKDHTTKSIKVFSNGRLQITGITSVVEASDVSKIVCNIVNNIHQCSRHTLELDNVSIAMINTNFSYNCGIDIVKLQFLLRSKKNMIVSFDPDRYPGLNIKHTNSDASKTSILFFGTGNVVITGVKSFKGILEAFSTVTEVVRENLSELKTGIKVEKQLKTASIRALSDGYLKRDLRCVGVCC